MPETTAQSRTTLAPDSMATRKLRYTIAIMCVSPILIWQLQNPFSASAARLIFLGILLLGLIWWSAAFLLCLIQLDLYLTNTEIGSSREPPGLIIAFCCVVLLMLLSRLRSSQELTGVRSITQLLRAAMNAWSQPAKAPSPIDDDKTNAATVRELMGIATRALLLVLGAGLLLEMLPIEQSSVREVGLTPTGLRTISIGLVLFTGYLVLTLPLSEVRWRRLTPDQADIYLRSRLVCWLHRDLRAVERYQRRLRRIQARQLRRSGRNAFSQYSKRAD